MKCLSIRQPWAWAIIHAGKDIENRCWPTSYRGPLLIHASKGLTKAEYADFCEFAEDIPMVKVPDFASLERGGIVGRVLLEGCIDHSISPWFCGPFGFVLSDAKPLPFRVLKGQLGLFEVAA